LQIATTQTHESYMAHLVIAVSEFRNFPGFCHSPLGP